MEINIFRGRSHHCRLVRSCLLPTTRWTCPSKVAVPRRERYVSCILVIVRRLEAHLAKHLARSSIALVIARIKAENVGSMLLIDDIKAGVIKQAIFNPTTLCMALYFCLANIPGMSQEIWQGSDTGQRADEEYCVPQCKAWVSSFLRFFVRSTRISPLSNFSSAPSLHIFVLPSSYSGQDILAGRPSVAPCIVRSVPFPFFIAQC